MKIKDKRNKEAYKHQVGDIVEDSSYYFMVIYSDSKYHLLNLGTGKVDCTYDSLEEMTAENSNDKPLNVTLVINP